MNSIHLKYCSKLRLYVPLFVVLSIILTACGGAATPTMAPAPTATTAAAAAAPTDTALAPTQVSAISNTPVPAPMLTPVPLDRWKVATIPVGTNITSMAEGVGMIWLDTNSGFQKIDPVTNQVTTITTVNKPGPNMVIDGAVWVVDNYPDMSDPNAAVLKKLDPASGKVEATIALGDYAADCCTGIAATAGAIWLASFNTNRVMKINTQTNSIVATIPASGPLFLAVGGGSVWVCNHHSSNKDSILRIDPNTGAITARIDLGDQLGSGAILYTDSAVWVASWNRDTDHDAISRIDPQTNAVVATITYSTNLQFSLAVSVGSVWVLGAEGMLLRVDPQSNTIVEKVKVVSNPAGLLAIGSTLWVGDNAGSTLMKLDLTR